MAKISAASAPTGASQSKFMKVPPFLLLWNNFSTQNMDKSIVFELVFMVLPLFL
jgi:hypothetical protein